MSTKSKKKTPTKPRRKQTAVAIVRATQSEVIRHGKPTQWSLSDPEQVMQFGRILQQYIVKNALSVQIGNTQYAMVNGWQYAGISFGLTPIPHAPVKQHTKGEYITALYIDKLFKSKDGKKEWTKEVPVLVAYADDKEIIRQVREENKIVRSYTMPHFSYQCECDIVRLSDQQKVGFGVGLCSNLEDAKAGFQEYAVNSMSQTRAIGKGYRNLLSFVMKTAGFGDTPAEEMKPVKDFEDSFSHVEPINHMDVKPICGPARFKMIITAIMSGDKSGQKGQAVVDEAREHFQFTEEQEKAMTVAVRNSNK